jgi:DNA recombination protein RmuC
MEIVYLIVGMAIGFALAWFIKKSQQPLLADNTAVLDALRSELQTATNQKSGLASTVAFLEKEKEQLSLALQQHQQKVLELSNSLTSAQTQTQNIEARLAEQKDELSQLQQKFTKDFELVANKILEEKTQKFTDQNRQSLDVILNPLKEKIKDFEDKVQKVYDTEAAERNMLKGEIKQLMSLNQQMHVDTQNLTKALKGDTKTQGNWGEFILENILEKSGLVKDSEYKTQASVTTEDGKRYQPDVLINLPDGKCLIIDSKVSLVAYERFVSSDDDAVRLIAVKEHVQSLRNHIKGLSDKNYQNLYGVKSLDFVLLFMPIEPAFALAVQNDAQLFNDAFERNIVIVSPSTLLATLRTVANIWRQEYQNKNAVDIANKAGDMYDKFVGFVDDLISLGNKMRDSQKAYENAMNKLHQGTGNLVKRSEDLKKLGAKASKSLPPALLERADENQPNLPEA